WIKPDDMDRRCHGQYEWCSAGCLRKTKTDKRKLHQPRRTGHCYSGRGTVYYGRRNIYDREIPAVEYRFNPPRNIHDDRRGLQCDRYRWIGRSIREILVALSRAGFHHDRWNNQHPKFTVINRCSTHRFERSELQRDGWYNKRDLVRNG